MAAEPIPLSAEDRAILDLECETVAGHTCKVIRIGMGAPGPDAIRDLVADRIGRAPELSRRLGGTDEAPAWEPSDFEPSDLVVSHPPVASAGIPALVASLFEQRLDRSQPLWRMDYAPVAEGGAVLVWRIHHALADGTACVRFARELLFDPETGAPGRSEPGSRRKPGPAPDATVDHARRRVHLAAFIEREFGESVRSSPFGGQVGTRRRIALASVELGPLHDAAKRLDGATLNDAVLCVVAGALRRWLTEHHGSLGGVRVRVPVSLHHEGDAVANRDSFFSLHLPLNEPDPAARLAAVHAATAKRKEAHDAEAREELVRRLGSTSPRLARLCERIEASPRSFAVSVSNVPGPRAPVSVAGAPVTAMHTIAEIGARHALRVAVVSLAGDLHFGFCADPALVDDLDAMAEGVMIEAEILRDAARSARS